MKICVFIVRISGRLFWCIYYFLMGESNWTLGGSFLFTGCPLQMLPFDKFWSDKIMNSMKLVIPLHFISWKKKSFSDISRKWILPNMIRAVAALIIFGQMHFLLISENEFTHEIKCNGMTSFMKFMISHSVKYEWGGKFLICSFLE